MKLLFIGDVMLGRLVNEELKHKSPTFSWGDTLKIFKKADLRFCNLECVITDRESGWEAVPKLFHFRSDAKNVEVLKKAGINAVSLANNHVLDFSKEGLSDMLSILDKNGVVHAGAGENIMSAEKPAIIESKGLRIGFIAFTDNEPEWETLNNEPGVFYAPVNPDDGRVKHLVELIHETKATSDIVIVSVHWGPNWDCRPPEEHRNFAHALVDVGADIVFGHSPHVFRGVEVYEKKPIFYSCGDFIDDYAIDETERNDQSFIFITEFLEDGQLDSIYLYPTLISDFKANLASGSEAKEIASKMVELSAELDTKLLWSPKENCLIWRLF